MSLSLNQSQEGSKLLSVLKKIIGSNLKNITNRQDVHEKERKVNVELCLRTNKLECFRNY